MPRARDEITQLRAPGVGGDQLLLADGDPDARQWLRGVVAGRYGLDEVDTGAAALERIAAGASRIVIVGRRLADMDGEELLARAAPYLGAEHRTPVTFLLADPAGETPEVDDTQIQVFYRLVRGMDPRRVGELVAQATARLPPLPPREPDPALAAVVVEHARAIGAQAEPDAAARTAIAAVCQLVGADRAHCLYCDDESGQLWSGEPAADDVDTEATAREAAGDGADDEHQRPAWPGIAGFAARAVAGVIVPRAGEDALYRAEIDNPGGTGRERLAVQPVPGPDGHVHAVLIAVRDERRPPFSHADLDRLEALAAAWAPYVLQLSMRVEADQILGDRLDRGPSDMFRQEAIVHLVRRGQRGDVVRVHPGWIRAAYWLVLASLIALLGFAAIAHIHEWTEGAAVVQFTGRSELIAHEAGTIGSLEAARGQRVERGQVLARLHDDEQVGQLRALETEFESKLIAYLQSPTDPAIKQALGQIRSQRDSARLSVESRTIRAPHAGLVKEVLVRNGQRVEVGSVVASIVADPVAEGIKVIAFLPGGDRPRLRAHQRLRVSLPGYRGVYLESEVRAVSEVIGAAEARARFLSDRLGDSVPLTGTVVVVEGRLTSPTFEADGETFQLHDGMIGHAEVQLQSRSVLESVIPGLH
ncbi:MAG TPA: HlyD family efflux transporter periplasmic adaptor subunit [Kofleriaceae bacterium]|nr:HlyD family efflux transporter periplasmic adaptor subunit [Kofleriaceae bacterium]